MGLYEYLQLSIDEQVDRLWEDGIFLQGLRGLALYSVYGFYVEVTISTGKIIEVVPFLKGKRLDKYLDKIKLP